MQDLLFAARLKADGKSVLFLPQSSTEGELVAPASLPDPVDRRLEGQDDRRRGRTRSTRIGCFCVPPRSRRPHLDLTKEAKAVFGAPPLLAAKVESGELDCGLLYWSQAARLEAKGYRRVSSTEEILKSLGAKGKVAVGGYLFKGDEKRVTIAAFRKALRQTENLLADTPEAWAPIRPLMKAPDEATFEALKAAYLRGIPRKSRTDEIADARSFFAIVARLGGSALVGSAKELPDDLYVDQATYG